jgi:glycosyltransferase involved in cell wall biosynthesis
VKHQEAKSQRDRKQQLIVVLGMHRSGTSIVTRGLEVVGVRLGDKLMPPVAGVNDKGFFEDLDIYALNEELLNVLGKHWYSIESVNSIDIDALCDRGYILRAIELLRGRLAKNEVFGFKDPRATKLLPFWLKVFEAGEFDVRFVLVLRNPIAVAISLQKRDKLEPEHAYYIWVDHYLSCLSFLKNHSVVSVDYDQLLQHPEQELHRVATWLGKALDQDALVSYRESFLDEGLRHSVFKSNDVYVDVSVPQLVKEIYAFLLEVQADNVTIGRVSESASLEKWQYELGRIRPAIRLSDKLYSRILVERGQIASLSQAVAERDGQIASLSQAVAERDAQIAALYNSTSWRIAGPLRFVGHQMKRFRRAAELTAHAIKCGGGWKNTSKKAIQLYRSEGLAGIKRRFRIVASYGQVIPSPVSGAFDRNDYAEWIRRYDTISDEDRVQMRERINRMLKQPLISVVMPTYNPKPDWLIEAIESVRKQIYQHWELCIADDVSTDPAVRPILESYAKEDARIKVVFREQNGHISAASNSALELVTGEWVALLDHDDLLAEQALFWVADAINSNPDLRLIYSDEDKLDEVGRRCDPYFKCDWNADLFYSQNLISHLGVYRSDLLNAIGGFRVGLEGAQDYDLALRCVEYIEPKQIHHIPRVLYHWRMHAASTAQFAGSKPYAMLAGEKALNEHLQRQGIIAKAELLDFGMYRVSYALPDTPPMVSLIIPTRNRLQLLRQCVESILKKTSYPNYEILIVDNGSDDPATLQYFREIESEARVRVLRDDRPFNYSALNNAAVKVARGELVALINNDIEVISPEWLSEMVSHALRPSIGAVGARLWYPNKKLQHGGVILGLGGVAGHSHKYLDHTQYGYFGRANLVQSFSAVTAACLVIRKTIFEEVGGLNETDLPIAFNDVDFCLRVREAGYRNVWTPYAELYHHESATRGLEDTPEKQARFDKEQHYMKQRWGDQLLNDPAYSPNLTLDHTDFSLAWPPRVEHF